MRRIGFLASLFVLVALLFSGKKTEPLKISPATEHHTKDVVEIAGVFSEGESLYDIFVERDIPLKYLPEIYKKTRKVFDLKKLRAGRSYRLVLKKDSENTVLEEFRYSIDDYHILTVKRTPEGFRAVKEEVPYQKVYTLLEGTIEDNLITAIGPTPEHQKVAFEVAEALEGVIDFVTELRRGDRFRILVEALWLDGAFKGFGKVLAIEFINQGRKYEAYLFKLKGKEYYFDPKGHSMERALMRAPLRFRYISSRFSYRRKHPILKIYRPHLGVDYAAPRGTPVSAAGDGRVIFAGWRRQMGKTIIIRHPNGYRTYYGHLSRIAVRKGQRVRQGQIIGYVGATGLATGPHLDYRIKKNGRFINPLAMKMPPAKRIPKNLRETFLKRVENFRYLMAKLSKQAPLVARRQVGH